LVLNSVDAKKLVLSVTRPNPPLRRRSKLEFSPLITRLLKVV